MIILGIDPGLQNTGWGVIETQGNSLKHIANGTIKTKTSDEMSFRLARIYYDLNTVLDIYKPDTAAVEETFVNNNPISTLKLGQARGIALMTPALKGIEVGEYAPNAIKKAIVGAGHAGKEQMQMMVSTLLPAVEFSSPDAADALAVAICHAHHCQTHHRVNLAMLED